MTGNLIIESIGAALAQRPAQPGPAWRAFEAHAAEVVAAGLCGRIDHVNLAAEGLPEKYRAAIEERLQTPALAPAADVAFAAEAAPGAAAAQEPPGAPTPPAAAGAAPAPRPPAPGRARR